MIQCKKHSPLYSDLVEVIIIVYIYTYSIDRLAMCHLVKNNDFRTLGLHSLAAMTSCCKIAWNLEVRRFVHDDFIKWKQFPRYWPFVRGIHRSPMNSLHKGQWRGALMFYLICVWINSWENNREAGDLGRYRAHYDVIVMIYTFLISPKLDRNLGSSATEMPVEFRSDTIIITFSLAYSILHEIWW